MKKFRFTFILTFTLAVIPATWLLAKNILKENLSEKFPNVLDISFTPDINDETRGLFTDAGAWMGFTTPSASKPVMGFCGPFDIDGRRWISKCFAEVGATYKSRLLTPSDFTLKTTNYTPGKIELSAQNGDLNIQQALQFIDKNFALLTITANNSVRWYIESEVWEKQNIHQEGNTIIVEQQNGEIMTITAPKDFSITLKDSKYWLQSKSNSSKTHIIVGFFTDNKQKSSNFKISNLILHNPDRYSNLSKDRWNEYLRKTLRSDMSSDANRIAAKSLVTLISNWRSAKGDLFHDGIIPSHAVGYFVGFWAWDSWKHAVAVAHFEPELAKNQIRAMFDYQLKDGMVIDCIYSNKNENNARDSKPPLAAWAVMEVYNQTKDANFIKEMYPKLVSYYRWWYSHRDNDHNGICEFGATDGTTEAAKWESGMDNAVRFDSTGMVKNANEAWSFSQESVDLNAYLCFETRLLSKMAKIIGQPFKPLVDPTKVNNFFFDSKTGYYYDKTLKGDFVRIDGPEGWIPLWTGIATAENAKLAMKIIGNKDKFSTYIPFPTLAADNPKFNPKGYWRGPIWLDQVYFGISGIRKYGYTKEADMYTNQVFERLNGLKESAPIHENYGTHTGERLKAPHFSWSAAHLLLLYWEYGK